MALSVGNTSGVVVGQIFKAQDAPRYLLGVKVVLGFTVLAIVLTVGQAVGLRWVNKKRAQRLTTEVANQGMEVFGGKEMSDWDDTFVYNL